MRTFPECCGNVDESAVNRARVEKEGVGSLEDFGQGQLDWALKGEWRVCRQGMGEGCFYQSEHDRQRPAIMAACALFGKPQESSVARLPTGSGEK